ncbi:hypothetical protein [Nocardia macrotermitis]|uniref:Uncharacterized protein n=1 Tax=Nocardia macrotermitis TaxID=2585198 RepID=A0A7K0D3Z1_9NOCA|nr:hypothetical protein [Nocardia macrotermitis]MQY20440.1 hypothetical protein [Nocardia macrotermitis]
MSEPAEALRDDLRRVAWCDYATIDAAAGLLGAREIIVLAGRLGDLATHLAARSGDPSGPPGALPGTERIDLTANWDSVTVAGWFVRNTLRRWVWIDILFTAELVTYELTKAFVTAVQDHEPNAPTRMTVRLRAISANRLVIEVHDSPANTAALAQADGLISECAHEASVRSGQCRAGGRTVVWCELARPEYNQWI